MIGMMSITITLLAAVQWIVIRRVRMRFFRFLLQVPLLIATFFGAWLFAGIVTVDGAVPANEETIFLDRTSVVRDDLRVTVSATGALLPERQVALLFGISGAPVKEILFEPGQAVTAGQLLVILDTVDADRAVDDARIALELQQIRLDALTIAPREVDLAVAEAQLTAARSQLNAAFSTGTGAEDREIARLQAEIARNQLWQAQLGRDAIAPPSPISLDVSGLTTVPAGVPNPPADAIQAGLDTFTDSLNSTLQGLNAQQQQQFQSQLNQTQSIVNQAEFGVQIADARLAGTLARGADAGSVASANAAVVQAQIALDRLRNGPTTLELEQAAIQLELAQLAYELALVSQSQGRLLAPFDGVIAQSNLRVGEFPPQGAAVVLIDDGEFFVDLPVDESEIARVAIGQRVLFDVDALPGTQIQGEVVSIAYSPLTLGQLVAYNTRVRVDAGEHRIRAGMTVTGNVIVVEREDVLLLRNSFIRRSRLSGDALVWVLNAEGVPEERLILLGDRNDSYSEVLAGLNEGDQVVLLPVTDSGFGG